MPLNANDLNKFAKIFDTAYEEKAVSVRGNFLRLYPLNQLSNITLDEYVIGMGTESFCACVEAKTRAWANMQGATANKFGIYFGKTKSDNNKQYRFTQKFGETKDEAFQAVKEALLNLIQAGRSKNFREIDENPLSQMFKAKILSLYFPELYLNICSSEHLQIITAQMKISGQQFASERQNLLVREKLENNITRDWSNPKFMQFLYAKFIRENLSISTHDKIKKPRENARHKVNFEDILKNRDAIGKASEEFAIEWEKDRLLGLGHQDLITKIKDLRDRPSYGYDYLSFSAPGRKRCIEVKSVGRDKNKDCYRFYLSENEREVSKLHKEANDYYFYLVFFDKDGNPCHLLAREANQFYMKTEIIPCAHVVRFDIEDIK